MPRPGPLSGITIVDLTRVLAGPYCTMVLADLGARVIKLERPPRGDDSREIGPFIESADGSTRKSAYFLSLNRGKQSVAVDLRDPEGRKLFEGLLARADVLVENFRPGTMEKLGYGWQTLHARYPRLIYAATSGFGHTGPRATRPAYDIVAQAMGGIMSLTGEPGGEPVRVGTSLGDIAAGLFTAIGVNAALVHRAETGEATKVDVAMLDCQVAMLENAIARYQATGNVPGPLGSHHPSIAPFGSFRTADGAMVLAAGNDALFGRLCRVLAREELCTRTDFETNEGRTQHRAALEAELEQTLRLRSTAHWCAALEEAGVPCGPIQNVAQLLEDPQLQARNMFARVEDPELGPLKVAGNPIKLSAFADDAVRDPAPDLDADRERILEELGLVRKDETG